MTLRGFIALRVNGYRGVDFSDPASDAAAFASALRRLIADGTAVLLPTVCTVAAAAYERILPLLTRVIGTAEFAVNACQAALRLDEHQIEALAVRHPLRLIGAEDRYRPSALPRARDGSWQPAA